MVVIFVFMAEHLMIEFVWWLLKVAPTLPPKVSAMVARYRTTSAVPPLMWTGSPLSSWGTHSKY